MSAVLLPLTLYPTRQSGTSCRCTRCVFKGIKLCQLRAANTAQARRLAAKIADAVIHITEPPAEINSWPSASCCGQPLAAAPSRFRQQQKFETTAFTNICSHLSAACDSNRHQGAATAETGGGGKKLPAIEGRSQRKLSSSGNPQRGWNQIRKPVYAPDGNFGIPATRH